MRATKHLVIQATEEAFRRDEVGRFERLAQQLDDVGLLAAHVEFDLATGGLVEPGQAVEYRGLAGTVRPDQGKDRVAFDLEADIAQGLDATEVHHQFFHREYDFTHGAVLS